MLSGKPAQSNLMLGTSCNLLSAHTKWCHHVTFRFKSQIASREYHLTWFHLIERYTPMSNASVGRIQSEESPTPSFVLGHLCIYRNLVQTPAIIIGSCRRQLRTRLSVSALPWLSVSLPMLSSQTATSLQALTCGAHVRVVRLRVLPSLSGRALPVV